MDAVVIDFDKKRRLKYTKESYWEILGNLEISKGSGYLLERKLNELDLKFLSVFLWAGLNWEDPLLNLARVENILLQYENNPVKLKEFETAIVEALRLVVKSQVCQPEN